MLRLSSFFILCLLVFTGCSAEEPVNAFQVTLPPTQSAALLATAVPTTARPPTATSTQRPSVTPSLTPSETLTPTQTLPPTDTLTPSLTPTLERVEHFYFGRPIAQGGIDYIDRNYPYGSTQLGRYPVHSGVEFQNPRGTPVLAVGNGEVFYAGTDSKRQFGPRLDYYGNLVVIRHSVPTPEGEPIFSVYAHLDRIEVETGDSVEQGDRVGVVGGTGIAIGPHLHFEIRVGDPEDFYSTRNPEMWIYPYPSFGMIAGIVTDSDGNALPDIQINIRSLSNPSTNIWYAYSYEGEEATPDFLWGENFTLSDLPEGSYNVVVSDENGKHLFEEQVSVIPGGIAWVEIILDQLP
jgi:murein DD-endopeptidase MepM/ murein hydrolase activator NlpD